MLHKTLSQRRPSLERKRPVASMQHLSICETPLAQRLTMGRSKRELRQQGMVHVVKGRRRSAGDVRQGRARG